MVYQTIYSYPILILASDWPAEKRLYQLGLQTLGEGVLDYFHVWYSSIK